MQQNCMQRMWILGLSIIMAFVAATIPARADETSKLRERLKNYPYQIVFETYRHNNWELFRMNADGSHPVNLTHTDNCHELYPKCSPDGARIAFVIDNIQDGQTVRSVYYMNADGTGRVKIADRARQPCWSPDGKTIAFLKSQYTKFNVWDYATKGIYFYNLETRKITEHPNKKIEHLYNICWSKNGRWIVATVHGGMGYKHAILAIETHGDKVINLGIPGCRPDLSPDGTKVVWGKSDTALGIADIDLNSETPRVTNVRELVTDKLHVYHADWSPDGRYVAFSRGPGGRMQPNGPGTNKGVAELVGVRAQWDTCVVPASGGPVVSLTHNGMSNEEPDWLVPAR